MKQIGEAIVGLHNMIRIFIITWSLLADAIKEIERNYSAKTKQYSLGN